MSIYWYILGILTVVSVFSTTASSKNTDIRDVIRNMPDIKDAAVFRNKSHDTWRRPCPCSNQDHCKRIQDRSRKEVFLFSVDHENWFKYDWSKVTSVTFFNGLNDTLMCYAHSKGARVFSVANMAYEDLTNATARDLWVKVQVDMVLNNFLDGVNVDYESAIDMDDAEHRLGLTLYLSQLRGALLSVAPEAMVTIDFAWSAGGIDLRYYDYKALYDLVDLAFVMSYDERSQIVYDCIAWANSAYNNTLYGLKKFLEFLPSVKLILGVPWYGYGYPCTSYDQDTNTCHIRQVPFRGVNCSDAAGRQFPYSTIVNSDLPHSFTGRLWDPVAKSPFFSVKDPETDTVTQYWYDDPESLAIKYSIVQDLNLRGLGMFTSDSIDYADPDMIRNMWGAIPKFK